MTGRLRRYVRVAVVAVFLLPLLTLLLLAFERCWTYWSYRTQAGSYISDIEKFKLEHGFYPDPRTQMIVPQVSPYSYGSDGQRYCVGFSLYIDDDYTYCSQTGEWVVGLGTIFEWPTGSWPPTAAPNDK
jgi:hypothetical protein